ncbi:MAG: cytochrome P450 [Alphaproteobacteria bacterium]
MTETVVHFDPRAPEVIRDPYPVLHELMRDEPVHWSARLGGWCVTRYDDVRQGFRDPRLSADRIRPFVAQAGGPDAEPIRWLGEVLTRWAVFNDPPIHSRLRAPMATAFTSRAIEALRPNIAGIVDELIDRMAGQGAVDFHHAFAYPLPATVIADLLGVPREDVDHLKRWSDALAQFVLTSRTNPEKYRLAAAGLREMVDYFDRFLLQRRRDPGELVTDAILAAADGDHALALEDVTATCILLLFAGHETTTQLIANGLLALIENPDQLADLRAHVHDPAVVRGAVEEMLRFDGPSLTSPRVAAADFEWHGQPIRQGQRVFLFNAAANRDPRVFAEPDRFDIRRAEAGRHLTFGYGIHFCVGAPLARLEAEIAFPILLRRFKDFELVEPRQDWSDSVVTRGMLRLPVKLIS